jgi:hypothetical protein
LIDQLPQTSRLHKAIDPGNVWDIKEYFLASIANTGKLLVWAKTKDGQKGRNKPELFKPPQVQEQSKDKQGKSITGKPMSITEYEKFIKGEAKENAK